MSSAGSANVQPGRAHAAVRAHGGETVGLSVSEGCRPFPTGWLCRVFLFCQIGAHAIFSLACLPTDLRGRGRAVGKVSAELQPRQTPMQQHQSPGGMAAWTRPVENAAGNQRVALVPSGVAKSLAMRGDVGLNNAREWIFRFQFPFVNLFRA